MTQEKFVIKETKLWHYEDAPKEVQEKILEHWRETYSGREDDYADNDMIIYLKKSKTNKEIIGHEIFKGIKPTTWNVGWGSRYVGFDNLEIADKEKFKKAFGISDSLWNKVDFVFETNGDTQTEIKFRLAIGGMSSELDLDEEYDRVDGYNFQDIEREDKPTRKEFDRLKKISETFEELMNESAKFLDECYEYEFKDENIIGNIEANDYLFNENGHIDSQ